MIPGETIDGNSMVLSNAHSKTSRDLCVRMQIPVLQPLVKFKIGVMKNKVKFYLVILGHKQVRCWCSNIFEIR